MVPLHLPYRTGVTGVLDTPDALLELEAGWEDLAARATFPTATHAWTVAAAKTLVGGGRLLVATVERRGRLVAAAPLVMHGDRAEILGGAELREPADLLYETAEDCRDLAAWLAREGLVLTLRRLPRGSPTVSALRAAHQRRAVVAVRPTPGTPTIALTGWDTRRLSPRRASDLRRAERRARALGPVVATVIAPSPDEAPVLLARAAAIEYRSWKAREGTALLQDELRRPFFEELVRRAAATGSLRFAFLEIDGRPAATQIALRHRDAYWVLKMGYDEEFARCSPGILLIHHTVEQAAQAGLHSYELLGYPEAWTQAWTQEERPLNGVRVYPGLRGMARLGADVGDLARMHLTPRW
jgi:CelD/BcsL family acetyltransferase involved in cellulose biosynthesis